MESGVIAFIGAGNMGSSLIGGLLQNGHAADAIWASDPSEDKLIELKNKFGVHISTNNNEVAALADVLIFAVKPQVFENVATAIAPAIATRKPLVISIAAGTREENIQKWLGGNIAIVRTMPNTPALIRCGATALYANKYVSSEQHKQADTIMKAVGITVWVKDESLLDTVTALSGSGPAYYFMIMEAMQTAATELGLNHDVAGLLAKQTALGAARMAIESNIPLEQLRKNVTSPGGTTEQGLSVLEKHNIKDICKEILAAAKLRSEELAKN